jgi:hypothetical protein
MDTFDGSKPNLISSKTIEKFENQYNPIQIDNNNIIISNNESFYKRYIRPNMFAIIVISLFVLYLFIKYTLKKNKEKDFDGDNDDEINFDEDFTKLILKDDLKRLSKLTNDIDEDININIKDDDLSDLISDDYLLTDETNEDRLQHSFGLNNSMNYNTITNSNLSNTMSYPQNTFDMNRASKLIFGE